MKIKIIIVCAIILGISGCATSKSALMNAASMGDIETVQKLVKNGANINEKDRSGYTPLIWAIYSNKVEAVKAFIQMGADIEIQDKSGYTPLILAVSWSHSDIAKLLIEKHANVNAKSDNGTTALIYAATYGNASIMKLLIDNGADVSVKDNQGKTPFQYALYYQQIDSIALLRIMGEKSTDTKAGSAFDEAARAPSRFTPEEEDYLIPAGRKAAYAIAVSDCNDILIPYSRGLLKMGGPIIYAVSLAKAKAIMADEFPACMEKMGFKLNPSHKK